MIKIDQSAIYVPEGPTVLFRNLFLDGTISASSETVGGEKENVSDTFTYDFWTPAAMPASISAVTNNLSQMDAIGIAAHNLFSKGCAYRITYYGSTVPTRTNKHLYSEDFSATGWTLSNAANSALTPNAIKAPNATVTAGLFSHTTTASALRRMYASANIAVTPNTPHVAEIYLKAKGHSNIGVYLAASTSTSEVAAHARVDLAAGTVTAVVGTASLAKLDDDWYRLSLIGSTKTSTGYRLSIALENAAGGASPGVIGNGVYVWGAHVEQASTRMGYIKSGASAGVSNSMAATEFLAPESDAPIVVLLGELTVGAVSVEISGPNIPSIGVLYAGKSLELPAGIVAAYTPLYLAKDIQVETSRSRTGHFFGNRVLRRGFFGNVGLTPIHRSLVETTMRSFIDHYDDAQAFFFAASPSMFPLDTAYCWRAETSQPLRPTYSDSGEFMTMQLDLEAVA